MQQQVNPMQLIQMIKSGQNPQQLMMRVLEQQSVQGGNPIYGNLLNMAKNGQTADIERFARNLAKEQGIDFDKEFNAFKRRFGL